MRFCIGPLEVMLPPCSIEASILTCYVARGLRAGASIAVPGGLTARKESWSNA